MDRINMNAFREIKKQKQQNADNKSKSLVKTQVKAKVNTTLNNKPSVNTSSNQFQNKQQSISNSLTKNFNKINLNNENSKTNNQTSKNLDGTNPRIFIKKDEMKKETTIAGFVKDSEEPGELVQFKVKTRSPAQPNLDFNPVNKINSKQVAIQSPEDKMIKDVLVNTVKTNKLTLGTTQMMENERIHAQEAIESGIYVTWSSKTQMGNTVDCFRIGSNSMCICNHGFNSHDKILNKKKHSSKCQSCKCKAFTYIPLYPEEIGEYWMPYQKNFDYKTWRGKCKCKHTWDEHTAEQFLKCRKCNCYAFNSNFCCAVCDKFWQDHEMIWELEHERYMNKKPIGQDFVPFAELPEMHQALYGKEINN